MNRYGQTITWSTIAAPHLFTGECTAYSMRNMRTRQLIDDEAGDNLALVLHSEKAELNFEAKVRETSTDFLDLSAGAAIAVSGISSGVTLARRAVEKWALLQPKTASVEATYYPDMAQASPVLAGSETAFTPAGQTLPIIAPGGKLIYSTQGLGHASGIVHELTLEQQLQITEDEPSPDGKILGAATHGYLRTIQLMLLATGALPATNSVLALTGAPGTAAHYRIEHAEERFADKRGMMYSVSAVWIPPFA